MATLSDLAYERLKDIILEAEPGTFFSVRKCANQLNLSYTPTREALLRLHSEGLLNLVPKVGFFTAQMDLRDITNIYQSRECVEQYVLPMVLPHIREEDKKFLYQMIERQEEALEQRDFNTYSETDVDFHCYMVDLLNNRRLSEFYKSIRSQYRVASNSLVKEHSKASINEHKEFMEFLEEERYEDAVQVMKDHTKKAIQRMREGFVRIGY